MSILNLKGLLPTPDQQVTRDDVTPEFLEKLIALNPQLEGVELKEVYALLGIEMPTVDLMQGQAQGFQALEKILGVEPEASGDASSWIQVPEVQEVQAIQEGPAEVSAPGQKGVGDGDITGTFETNYSRATLESFSTTGRDNLNNDIAGGPYTDQFDTKETIDPLGDVDAPNIRFTDPLDEPAVPPELVADDDTGVDAAAPAAAPLPPDAVDDFFEFSEIIPRIIQVIDLGSGILDNDVNGVDGTNNNLTITLPVGGVELFDSGNNSLGTGFLTFDGSQFIFFPFDGSSFLPAEPGAYHFDYTIVNDSGLTDTATVTIFYNNNPPIPVLDIVNVFGVNTPVSFSFLGLLFNDITGDNLIGIPPFPTPGPIALFADPSFSIPINPALYSLSFGGGGNFTFTGTGVGGSLPNGTYFTPYQVSDGQLSAFGTIQINLVNAAPIANIGQTIVVGTTAGSADIIPPPDAGKGFLPRDLPAADDIDSDPLTVIAPPVGAVALFATAADALANINPLNPVANGFNFFFDGTNYVLQTNRSFVDFLPQGDYFFRYQVTDGALTTTGVHEILYVDTAPVPQPQIFTVPLDTLAHVLTTSDFLATQASDLTDINVLFDTRLISGPSISDIDLRDASNNIVNPALYNFTFDGIGNYTFQMVGIILPFGDYTFQYTLSDGLLSTTGTDIIRIGNAPPGVIANAGQSSDQVSIDTINTLLNTQKVDAILRGLPSTETDELDAAHLKQGMNPFTFVAPQNNVTAFFLHEGAGFQNGIGFYNVLSDGTITNAHMMWPNASIPPLSGGADLTNPATTLTGASTFNLGNFAIGDKLSFFMVSDMFGQNGGHTVIIAGNTFSEITIGGQNIAFDAAGNPFLHQGANLFAGQLGFFNELGGGVLTQAHITDTNPKLYFVTDDPNLPDNANIPNLNGILTDTAIKIPTEYGSNQGWWHATDLNHTQLNSDNNPAAADPTDNLHVFSAFDVDWNLWVGFEDLRNQGDTDFNDVMFAIPLLPQRNYFNTPLVDVTVTEPQGEQIQGAIVTLDPGVTNTTFFLPAAYMTQLAGLGLTASLSVDKLQVTINGLASAATYSNQVLDIAARTLPTASQNNIQLDIGIDPGHPPQIAGNVFVHVDVIDATGHLSNLATAPVTFVP